MADSQQVVREFLDLSVEEKREAKEALARAGELAQPQMLTQPEAMPEAMPEAGPGVTNILWVMIVTTFVIVLLGGGYLLYDMSKNGQDTSVILPIITTVLGALVGLMAPSPVQRNR
jgi:hypothetical protein